MPALCDVRALRALRAMPAMRALRAMPAMRALRASQRAVDVDQRGVDAVLLLGGLLLRGLLCGWMLLRRCFLLCSMDFLLRGLATLQGCIAGSAATDGTVLRPASLARESTSAIAPAAAF